MSPSPSPPPFCGIPFDMEPVPEPEPALEPELLPPDAEPLPELSESLWCLWCMGAIVGEGLLAGLLAAAGAAGAELCAGACAAWDAPPQAVTRPRIAAASKNSSRLLSIWLSPLWFVPRCGR